jgi:hypothetical protein
MDAPTRENFNPSRASFDDRRHDGALPVRRDVDDRGGTFVAHGARLPALVLPAAGQSTGTATPATVKARFVAQWLSRQ